MSSLYALKGLGYDVFGTVDEFLHLASLSFRAPIHKGGSGYCGKTLNQKTAPRIPPMTGATTGTHA